MVNYKIDLVKDFWQVQIQLQKQLEVWMNKAIQVLLEELKRLTPEDTKEMVNSYKVLDARIEWNNMIASVGNTADHSIDVEFSIDWRTFNYHKPKWRTVYTWIWNRTFARAVDNKRQEILNIIANSIW